MGILFKLILPLCCVLPVAVCMIIYGFENYYEPKCDYLDNGFGLGKWMAIAWIFYLVNPVIAFFTLEVDDSPSRGYTERKQQIVRCLLGVVMIGYTIYGLVLIYKYGPNDSPCPDPVQPFAWYLYTIGLSLGGLACCCSCALMMTNAPMNR